MFISMQEMKLLIGVYSYSDIANKNDRPTLFKVLWHDWFDCKTLITTSQTGCRQRERIRLSRYTAPRHVHWSWGKSTTRHRFVLGWVTAREDWALWTWTVRWCELNMWLTIYMTSSCWHERKMNQTKLEYKYQCIKYTYLPTYLPIPTYIAYIHTYIYTYIVFTHIVVQRTIHSHFVNEQLIAATNKITSTKFAWSLILRYEVD